MLIFEASRDHKASGNHDFVVRDDFQALQRTLQGTEPTNYIER